MADGPAKDEANRLLDILRTEMHAYQVQSEEYKKQNEQYKEILAEKEEMAEEIAAEERSDLDSRFDRTMEEYSESREDYADALYEF